MRRYGKKDVLWYVLFAPYGKLKHAKPFLEAAQIDYFYPEQYMPQTDKHGRQIKSALQPLLGNYMFVKSSKEALEPVIQEIKERLHLTSDLFYRYLGDKQIIVVPEEQMTNFIAVAGNQKEQIMYLSNEEVHLEKGTKVKITGGVFEGVEGIFLKIKGNKRVIVSIPNLFSVATAYVPTCFIQPME